MGPYTTEGSVRGCCGHKHKSIRTAYACFVRDYEGCRSQGGYSDRNVVQCDGEPLTKDEGEEVDYCEYIDED